MYLTQRSQNNSFSSIILNSILRICQVVTLLCNHKLLQIHFWESFLLLPRPPPPTNLKVVSRLICGLSTIADISRNSTTKHAEGNTARLKTGSSLGMGGITTTKYTQWHIGKKMRDVMQVWCSDDHNVFCPLQYLFYHHNQNYTNSKCESGWIPKARVNTRYST